MLVLTRRVGEEIVIDDKIRVTVLEAKGERVRIGVTAPKSVRVDRHEVHARREQFAAGPDWVGTPAIAGKVAKSLGRAALPVLFVLAQDRSRELIQIPLRHGTKM